MSNEPKKTYNPVLLGFIYVGMIYGMYVMMTYEYTGGIPDAKEPTYKGKTIEQYHAEKLFRSYKTIQEVERHETAMGN